jgi:hypothetical protein
MMDDSGSGLGFEDEELENEEFNDPMQEYEPLPQLLVTPLSPPQLFQAPANNVMETFDPPIDSDPGINMNDDSDVTSLDIPAMNTKAYMRLTYLQAVLGNVFGKLIVQLHNCALAPHCTFFPWLAHFLSLSTSFHPSKCATTAWY